MTTGVPAGDGRFRTWLAAATASTLGDAVTYFALAWTATAFGAGFGSLVLTIDGIPLLLLVLVGGVAADRYGIRRTMIACDAAMVGVMAVFAVGSIGGAAPWSLVVVALLSGSAEGLRRPAGSVFPRLFGTGPRLEKRMATVGGAMQIARIAGPAVGGVLVGMGGLSLTSSLDAVTFLLVLIALVAVRPPGEAARAPVEVRGWRSLVEGVAVARRTPGVSATVITVAAVAGAVLPLVALCLPLLARDRGWGASATGVVGAAWVLGGLAVTAMVAWRGAPTARVAVLGPPVAIAGVGLLVAVSSVAAAFVGLALVGVGTQLLTSRLFPAFLAATPPALLARFSSLLQLAQILPTTVLMPLLGGLAATTGVGGAVAVAGVLLLATALAAPRAISRFATPQPVSA